MSALTVDAPALTRLARTILATALRLEAAAQPVHVLARRAGGPGALDLRAASGRMVDLHQRVLAFARLVALVAADFTATEAGVAGSFLAPAQRLLESIDPAVLATLLAGSPTLARVVVDQPSSPDLPSPGLASPGLASTAGRLRGVLASGEPITVVLREARALLLALSATDRRRLALLHPGLVTAVSSAPVADRFAASRVLVSAEIARLRGRLGGLSGAARARAEQRLGWYGDLLTGSVTLVRPDGSRLARPHQILAFDPRGDGRVAEVFGDLSVAGHLAVYVPGTGTSLDRYAGNAERVSSFADAAPGLAVVLWQNADFPDQPQDQVIPPTALWGRPFHAVQQQLRDHVFAAAFRDSADRAGWLLAHDIEGLRMAQPGPAVDVTVLGHSYGGSVVGAAEARGLVVDRVVHIASAGAYVSDVRDYAAGECGTRRFSLTVPDDPIQLAQGAGFGSADQVDHSLGSASAALPGPLRPLAFPVATGLAVLSGNPLQVGHGLDPDLLPSLTRLESGVQADGHTLVSGHGGMFEPGSTGWRNLLAVMQGDAVRVMEPQLWRTTLHPAEVTGGGLRLPHYEVTRSPYDAGLGYAAPLRSSLDAACTRPSSW